MDQRQYQDQFRSALSSRENNITQQILASNDSHQQQLTERLGKLESLLTQQEARQTTDIATLTSLTQNFFGLLGSLQREVTEGFKNQAQILQCSKDLQGNVQAILDGSQDGKLDEELSECVDWLYWICKGGKEELDTSSEEAQLVTDKITTVLRALLQEIDPTSSLSPRRNLKSALDSEETADGIGLTHDEGRAVKRMRGLLESGQDVQFRKSCSFE